MPIQMQLGESVSPVVLINILHVASEDVDALLDAWEADTNWMKNQPGFISTQLPRGVGVSLGSKLPGCVRLMATENIVFDWATWGVLPLET